MLNVRPAWVLVGETLKKPVGDSAQRFQGENNRSGTHFHTNAQNMYI